MGMGAGGHLYPWASFYARAISICSRFIIEQHPGRESLDIAFLLVSPDDPVDGPVEWHDFFSISRNNSIAGSSQAPNCMRNAGNGGGNAGTHYNVHQLYMG